MIWIKGILRYQGKEIIMDDQWHSVVEEYDQLYIDGSLKVL